jgi:hypothetical protein
LLLKETKVKKILLLLGGGAEERGRSVCRGGPVCLAESDQWEDDRSQNGGRFFFEKMKGWLFSLAEG